ncbi:hypothetical protein JHS3_03660 [Jeongeupia sp. HS-3]|uniref:Card1-like endonuclease domain-containing protein n=1 Tax=Jeongeupia sp. HS-3 TaxID=1009682 RepID=UPI0018A45A62|nr:DUF1887 family CARF protein [Jeongeupia sp. HS-3]BCL74630.1 hypothetical protein JHS3_03660 [Jeongeupia sp. HS-3]
MHLLCPIDTVHSDILTPALDRIFGIQHMTVAAHSHRLNAAADIADIAAAAQIKCDIIELTGEDSPSLLRGTLAQIIHEAPMPTLINLSGASPILAALAQEVALLRQVPSFVIHPERDTLVWLNHLPNVQPAQGHNVADRLTLEGYFGLFGCDVIETSLDLKHRKPPLEKLARHMAWFASNDPRQLYSLMQHVVRADANGLTAPLPRELQPYLMAIEQAGLITLLHGGELKLRDAQALRFLNGGWLEYWLFAEAASLIGQCAIHDVACGVQIVTHDGVKNEYDLALLCNNQLYLVECKTQQPENRQIGRGVGNEVLFKLDSVSHLSELDARAMLVSVSRPTDHEIHRAEQQDIEIVCGHDLVDLRQHLKDWLSAH